MNEWGRRWRRMLIRFSLGGLVYRLLSLTFALLAFSLLASHRPRRLARPRTSPFHGGNAGSNPAGDANILKHLLRLTLSPEGSKGFDKEGTPDSAHLLGVFSRQNHSYDSCLSLALGFGHRLRVNVGGHLISGVAQQLLDGLDIFAVRLHECSEGVPQRVPTHVAADAGGFECGL